ncbi:MAG: radical SAM family heme chaperone HemW [Terriglobales bacterium]
MPFCAVKCSYCNFASQVFPPAWLGEYAELVARELALAATADGLEGARLDSIYWGGGTPSLMPPAVFEVIRQAIAAHFTLTPGVEHTLEAAPGTLAPERLEAFAAGGVNRLSFGVQSFQAEELRAVGRRHRAETVAEDLRRARAAGIANVSLDLIAGLPHQTAASWRDSLERAMASGAPHLSIYMLEVDGDSRLGREMLEGGSRYHAATVPGEEAIADFYELASARLPAEGWGQYEISNFAHAGGASRHNQRYWRREPYLGVGLDAHSLLTAGGARRFANPETLEAYRAGLEAGRLPRGEAEWLSAQAEREEHYFLGLRQNEGVADDPADGRLASLAERGLVEREGGRVALSARGRMLSNQVLAELLE